MSTAAAKRDKAATSAAALTVSPLTCSRDSTVSRSSRRHFPADLPHDELLAPRHRQRLGHAVQQDFPMRVAVVVHAALEAPDEIAGHQAIAVDAHEAVPELALEPRQRLLEQ